jgi:precorrin-3B methylase
VARATNEAGFNLVVVGTGIQVGAHSTPAARLAIERADSVLYAVSNPETADWIRQLNPAAQALAYPRDGRRRRAIYAQMVEQILERLRAGERVCAAFYGSAAVLVQPAHEAMRRARSEGFRARMLPGISSLECLFADLGVDPGEHGCAMYEAADLLMRPRVLDRHAHLVLCQVGLIANRAAFDPSPALLRRGLELLRARLLELYPAQHGAILYEAAENPMLEPRATAVELGELERAEVSAFSTLYVPPLERAQADWAWMRRLSPSDGASADDTSDGGSPIYAKELP